MDFITIWGPVKNSGEHLSSPSPTTTISLFPSMKAPCILPFSCFFLPFLLTTICSSVSFPSSFPWQPLLGKTVAQLYIARCWAGLSCIVGNTQELAGGTSLSLVSFSLHYFVPPPGTPHILSCLCPFIPIHLPPIISYIFYL